LRKDKDKEKGPPGGWAKKRLQQFEEARGIPTDEERLEGHEDQENIEDKEDEEDKEDK
jgi:hypothetical protein